MPRKKGRYRRKKRRVKITFEGPTTPSSSEDEALDAIESPLSSEKSSLTALDSPSTNPEFQAEKSYQEELDHPTAFKSCYSNFEMQKLYSFEKQIFMPRPFEFYRTIDERVHVFRNGEIFADLFPGAIVQLAWTPREINDLGQITIRYPMPFCTIKKSSLAWRLQKENCRKILYMTKNKQQDNYLRQREKYVAWVWSRTSIVEVQRNLLDFVCELLENVCVHKFIDVSYKPNSLIAQYSQHQDHQVDFRDFQFPLINEHVTLYVNLPWFYKQQLLDFLERVLKTANDFDVLVDILVLHHYQKEYHEDLWRKNLQEKCFKTWIWKDVSFYDADKDRNFSLKRGKTFCGLVSNGNSEHKQKIVEISKFLIEDLGLK